MKKKILALCLVVVLGITAVTGVTLAYFTDTDAAKNVMTTGNVAIKQLEEQRYNDENGDFYTLGDFVNDQKLIPYTGAVNNDGVANSPDYPEKLTIGEETYGMFEQEKNAIDKIVRVTNIGTEECYVRTLFAWEMIEVDGELVNPILDDYIIPYSVEDAKGIGMPVCDSAKGVARVIEIDGKKYCVAQYDYPVLLQPEQTTEPSLKGFYVNAKINNELAEMIGGDNEYNILVLSQAVQTAGFKTGDEYKFAEADAAFSAAFGGVDYNSANMVDDATLVEWFTPVAEAAAGPIDPTP